MSGVKCTNKKKCFLVGLTAVLLASCLTGCGNMALSFPYDAEYDVSSFKVVQTGNVSRASSFAEDFCVVTEDFAEDETVDMTETASALLCDVNNKEVLFAKNVHERMHPASLTKIMTALVAIKYGSMDQVLTAGSSVNITEKGAQLCGVKPGDTMTLAQALHILLIYSANDVAMMIAEGVGGSVDGFVEMMNGEAARLGATNTCFSNPHGLTQDNHYTTAYDLYLIFNEAVSYEDFRDIIHMTAYETVYHDKEGKEKNLSVKSTNRYIKGDFKVPDNVTLIGGKTGTTNAAGHCLILLSKDNSGAPYISVVMRSGTSDACYKVMTELLTKIGN